MYVSSFMRFSAPNVCHQRRISFEKEGVVRKVRVSVVYMLILSRSWNLVNIYGELNECKDDSYRRIDTISYIKSKSILYKEKTYTRWVFFLLYLVSSRSLNVFPINFPLQISQAKPMCITHRNIICTIIF